jgi:hypothetical protein
MDQFHFVIKDSNSASLSKGDEEEAYRIRCHAQTRRRRGASSATPSIPAGRSRKPSHDTDTAMTTSCQHWEMPEMISTTIDLSQSSTGAAYVQSYWNHYFRCAARGERWHQPSVISFSVQPRGNSTDPFNSTSMAHEPSAWRLIQFLQSDFNHSNFRAETWERFPRAVARSDDFRHRTALSDRIHKAFQNDMLMFSTLAYASGALGWRYSVSLKHSPPEHFIQGAYQSIRNRLQQSEAVEEDLLWAIYGLAAAEMWVMNFDAAAKHMRVLQVLISQLGGITKLSPLVMESAILGGK